MYKKREICDFKSFKMDVLTLFCVGSPAKCDVVPQL